MRQPPGSDSGQTSYGTIGGLLHLRTMSDFSQFQELVLKRPELLSYQHRGFIGQIVFEHEKRMRQEPGINNLVRLLRDFHNLAPWDNFKETFDFYDGRSDVLLCHDWSENPGDISRDLESVAYQVKRVHYTHTWSVPSLQLRLHLEYFTHDPRDVTVYIRESTGEVMVYADDGGCYAFQKIPTKGFNLRDFVQNVIREMHAPGKMKLD